ncbi:MAG TPA: hypothetical protein VGD56_08120, partial [Gemmatirosa sp.]
MDAIAQGADAAAYAVDFARHVPGVSPTEMEIRDTQVARQEAADTYRVRAEAAIALLAAAGAPLVPRARKSFDPAPLDETPTDTSRGRLVAHLVLDEFPRRMVGPRPGGESWFWY